MNVVKVKLSDLHPLEKNVRRHNEKQIKEYARSLEKFKQIRPMVVDENHVILVGNGMYEAMKRLGWESADCEIVTGLSENDKKKLMLADNRVYELGMTDMQMFDEIIRDLGDDLDVPGWEKDLLETISSSIEDADALIENYGLYDPAEVSAVSSRQREDHTQYVGAGAPDSPLQQPSAPMQTPAPVSDRVETEAAETPTETAAARTIICPHCGRQITLTLDMIGGV